MTDVDASRVVIASRTAVHRSRRGPPDTSWRRSLRVGIVNNMPDAAFEQTHRQLMTLLEVGACGKPLDITGYRLPDVPGHSPALTAIPVPMHELQALYDAPPDALIVTGLKPRCADITAEPFWPELSRLLRWSADHVPSTLLSCLAAHAAAVALHGIPRVRLPEKKSGVFEHNVVSGHHLTRDLGPTVRFPHSRYNTISAAALRAHGYEVLVGSDDDWTVASRNGSGHQFVLLQGHPEYAPTTLLREYRRDVAQHLRGAAHEYPSIPEQYLDGEGERHMGALRLQYEGMRFTDPVPLFPFETLQRHIATTWASAARRLFRNWLQRADELAAPGPERDRRGGPRASSPPVHVAVDDVTVAE